MKNSRRFFRYTTSIPVYICSHPAKNAVVFSQAQNFFTDDQNLFFKLTVETASDLLYQLEMKSPKGVKVFKEVLALLLQAYRTVQDFQMRGEWRDVHTALITLRELETVKAKHKAKSDAPTSQLLYTLLVHLEQVFRYLHQLRKHSNRYVYHSPVCTFDEHSLNRFKQRLQGSDGMVNHLLINFIELMLLVENVLQQLHQANSITALPEQWPLTESSLSAGGFSFIQPKFFEPFASVLVYLRLGERSIYATGTVVDCAPHQQQYKLVLQAKDMTLSDQEHIILYIQQLELDQVNDLLGSDT